MSRPKPEDSAQGCRALAKSDREKAAAANGHMRATFERSAEAWTARAGLLERLEVNFKARAAAAVGDNPPRKQLRIRTA